jgi:peptidyl-prolyl cis-trans isomerase D
MIQDLLLEKQYEKIGLNVSPEELVDLITGATPHPYIAQIFTDPSTGIFNRQAFTLFMQRLENTYEMTDEKKYYLFLENQIVRETKYRKYYNLLNQGLYATAKETEHTGQCRARPWMLNMSLQGSIQYLTLTLQLRTKT